MSGSKLKAHLGGSRDHIVPLACGGPDAASNMQWQTAADERAKGRVAAEGVRALNPRELATVTSGRSDL